MSLDSKVEAEAEKRAKKAFENFLSRRKGYAGEGQRINLHRLIEACNDYMDKYPHAKHLGSASFQDVIFNAFVETNRDYFRGKVEDDLYKGAMNGLNKEN